MKLLIIGNATSPFIIHFTKWIKKARPNFVIDILNTFDSSNFGNTYNNVAQVFPKNHFKNPTKLTGLKSLYYINKRIKAIPNNEYDSIILHYIYPWYAILSKTLKKKTKKLIAVFWGSDLNRNSKYKKQRLLKLFHKTDAIILGSPYLFDKINADFPNFKSKYRMCYFGCEPIEDIKKLKENKVTNEYCKNICNIDPNKTTIVLGYNGGISQQHLKIIENLKSSLELISFKNKIHFILPLTYGLNDRYYKEIKKALKDFKYEYSILTKFMNEKESAVLRMATDVFVNLQLTDSFNATLRESFYAGSVVINGSWLPYKTLKEIGLYYHEIDDIKNLDSKLNHCLNHFKLEKEKSKINERLMYNITSWSKTIDCWLNVIEG